MGGLRDREKACSALDGQSSTPVFGGRCLLFHHTIFRRFSFCQTILQLSNPSEDKCSPAKLHYRSNDMETTSCQVASCQFASNSFGIAISIQCDISQRVGTNIQSQLLIMRFDNDRSSDQLNNKWPSPILQSEWILLYVAFCTLRQYCDRRKPEAGNMLYSYFEWLQGFFIV